MANDCSHSTFTLTVHSHDRFSHSSQLELQLWGQPQPFSQEKRFVLMPSWHLQCFGNSFRGLYLHVILNKYSRLLVLNWSVLASSAGSLLVEGIHEDHWVQPWAPHRTTPNANPMSEGLTECNPRTKHRMENAFYCQLFANV